MNPKTLFYPQAKFEVLRTLYYAADPVPLREISYRSNLVIGSVQTAVKTLLKEKIISCENQSHCTSYRLNNSQVEEVLSRMLEVLEHYRLEEQTRLIQHRAINILPQLEERSRIMARARKSLRE